MTREERLAELERARTELFESAVAYGQWCQSGSVSREEAILVSARLEGAALYFSQLKAVDQFLRPKGGA